jgi:hypothetical protein
VTRGGATAGVGLLGVLAATLVAGLRRLRRMTPAPSFFGVAWRPRPLALPG